MSSEIDTKPHDPDPIGGDLKTPINLLKVFIGTVIYSMLQCSSSSFAAIVDWTKHPDMGTVHAVLHSLPTSLTLGFIRGLEMGFMAVIIVFLGAPIWAIVGPIVSAAMANTVRFVGNLSRAMRSKDSGKGCKEGSQT